MWGDLGDAYRQNGDVVEAITAYRQAADIAERDYVRGAIPMADQAAQVESTAHRRMAQTWLLRGDIDRARKNLEAASERCPGYTQMPDMKCLTQSAE
jgi:tetratricopeptide (TPR) repeat protein